MSDDEELDMLQQKILRERGLDLREYDRERLKQSVRERLEANKLTSYTEYMELLDRQPDEYGQLFNVLLVDRYDFFYDPESLEVLKREIIPKVFAYKRKGSPVRVWAASCAEGAEPYSVGILIAETLGDSFYDYNIRIYATDINGTEIASARKGIYHAGRLKNLKTDERERYFIPEDSKYMIRTDIRQKVVFSAQNLTVEAPFYNIDLIVYRYALIYYNLEEQNKLLAKMHYALNDNGYVLFGKYEITPLTSKLFKPVNRKYGIFQKATEAAIPRAETREIMEDIIIERAAREAKRQLEAIDLYNRGIIQNLNFGLIAIDINNTVTHWNRAAGDIWLIKPENATGRNFFELDMNTRLPGIREKITEVETSRKTIRIDAMEITDFKGEKRLMDVVITPLIDPAGEMRGVIVTTSEVTGDRRCKEELSKAKEELKALSTKSETAERRARTISSELTAKNLELSSVREELKATNEELEATREQLRNRAELSNSEDLYNKTVARNMSQGLISLDGGCNITAWNPADEKMWNLKQNDAIGKNIFSLDMGTRIQGLRQKIEQAIEKGTIYRGTPEYTALSGEKRFMDLTIVPLINADGKYVGTVLLSQDVTGHRE